MFPLLASAGASLDSHNFSDTMDGGQATSSTSRSEPTAAPRRVPWTCAPSGPLDLLDPNPLLLRAVLCSPTLCLCLLRLGWCGWSSLAMKAGYLSLLHVPGNRVSRFLPERVHIVPSLPFITNVPIEALLVALNAPGQISFRL